MWLSIVLRIHDNANTIIVPSLKERNLKMSSEIIWSSTFKKKSQKYKKPLQINAAYLDLGERGLVYVSMNSDFSFSFCILFKV